MKQTYGGKLNKIAKLLHFCDAVQSHKCNEREFTGLSVRTAKKQRKNCPNSRIGTKRKKKAHVVPYFNLTKVAIH